MALIKTVAEVKKYFTLDGTFAFESLIPYLELAEDEVKKMLGKPLYLLLHAYYNGDNPDADAKLDALLPYCQRPIVYFAFLKGLDKLNVNIGNNGIGIISNQNLAPASKDRVENLRSSITEGAFDSLEYLLEFLEEKVEDYDTWKTSDAYTYQHQFLISSARKFDELYKINRSRLTFLNWMPAMADVEFLQINPVVSKELMDELKKQIKDGDLTDDNKVVLPLIQKALAYLTASKFNNKESFSDGEMYLMTVKTILDLSPDKYETYKDSTSYVSDLENYQAYENDPDSGFVCFG